MDAASNQPNTSHQGVSWWLGQLTLFTLLWLSTIKLLGPANIGLDASWQMVLGHANQNGLQYGRDLVFTYGPLGYYFRPSTYMGELFNAFFAWQIIGSIFMAAGFYCFGCLLTGWRQFVYYVYLFCFGTFYADTMHMVFVTLVGILLLKPIYQRPVWISLIAGCLAILSLVKFTNLMFCLFVVLVLAAYYWWQGNRRLCVILTAAFSAVFLTGWLVSGQHLSNLPAYLYYSLELSSGYIEAMGYYESDRMFTLGIAALLLSIAYAVLVYLTSVNRLRSIAILTIVAAVIFLNWKHGFVRADGHVLAHFMMVMLLACSFPALTEDNRRWLAAKNIVLGLALLTSLAGIRAIQLEAVLEAPGFWNDRLRYTLTALVDLPGYHQKLERDFRTELRTAPMGGIPEFIGHETMDHLGSDQAVPIFNQLNYTPRPAVQSYTAYTEALNRLDEAFYLSPRAPRFVVQRYQSIDNRLIAMDDSLTLKLLFQNYDYAFEAGGLLLWERPQKISPADPAQEKLLSQKTVAFDETVPVPATDQPIWAEITIQPTLLGKIRQFLYKPPTLSITLEDDLGQKHEFLFIRRIGITGFILQPFFKKSEDLIAYQTGQPAHSIRSLTLHSMPGGTPYFKKDISIKLTAIAPFKRGVDGLKPSQPHRFRMMNRAPQSLSSSSPINDLFTEGKHLLQMHPNSVMDFAINEPVSSITASFGIMPGAFSEEVGTAGVEFIVEWCTPEGNIEPLFHRFLDPMKQAADRPRQSLTVDLQGRVGGLLRLRTGTGPSLNGSYSWSYWTDIVIK